MANTLNLGNGNWGVKDSSLLGYKNRKNGRFLPETFDVSRGSAGTRVNQSGLIETPEEILSGELITNGSFATDSDWTKGTGISIGNDEAIFTSVSSGLQLSQLGLDGVSGKTYKISYEIKSRTEGAFSASIGATLSANQNSSVGVYTEYLTASGNGAFYIRSRGTTSGSIDNVSVVEVNRDNLARIDYLDDATGVLLTEPQSTNLITDSNDFSNSSWFKGANTEVSSSSFLSPSGYLDAYSLKSINSIANTYAYSSISISPLADYTFSFYARSNNPSAITVGKLCYLATNNGGGNVYLNASEITSEWKRYSVTATSSASSTSALCYLATDWDVNGEIEFYGAQVEELSYPTSYIPTNGAIATRLADVVNNAGDVNNFNSEEGVLFVEISALTDDLTNRFISISNGTKTERVEIGYSNVSNKILAISSVGNVTQCNLSFVLPNMLDYNKIAIKYKVNDFALWVNGVEVGTQTVGSVSAPNTLNELAFDEGDGTDIFYSKTKSIQVFDEALTDIELQTLTTI